MASILDTGITKLYYTISEVADLVEEEAHVLRYWETEFSQLHPKKNRGGKRVYTREDIDTVFRIRHLLRNEKYTIDGARQALSKKSGATEAPVETADLQEVKVFLQQLLERIKD